MSYNLRGFVSIASLIANAPGVNSPIGEPSTLALTYSRERGVYTKNTYPGFSLLGIGSYDTVSGAKVVVPTPIADHVLEVSSWLVTYAQAKGGLIDHDDTVDDLQAHFTGAMANLQIGTFVSDGSFSLPAFMDWTNPAQPANSIRVWYADGSFKVQYPLYEIVVIPPVPNLDDFFLSANQIKTLVQSRTPSQSTDLVQTAKGGFPETVHRLNSYDYKNLSAPTITFSSNWNVLIYGAAGDNIDAIKDSIIAYVLANSTHTREQWTEILPDLFKRTEFNFIPRWDKYAIPNLTVQAGIYSPMSNLKEDVTFVKARIPEYSGTHIDNYLAIMGGAYRSLSLLVISNPDNLNSKFSLLEDFPDIINVPTSSTDFGRMTQNTQAFLNMLETLLVAAESITELSDPPSGIRKVKRGNTLYVAKVFNTVQYLVAAKSGYPA